MEPKETSVKETLESIDGISRASANPFLYDKIMHRMQGALPSRVLKPVTLGWAVAFIALLIGLNVLSLAHYNKASTAQVSENPVGSEYFSYLNNY